MPKGPVRTTNLGLPRWLNVDGRRGTYYFRGPDYGDGGKVVGLGCDLEVALARYPELRAAAEAYLREKLARIAFARAAAHQELQNDPQRLAEARLLRLARWLYSRGLSSSKCRRISWELTRADVEAALRRAGGRCEISGIEFSDAKAGKRGMRPWLPTLDRIDSLQGYTPSNVRVVTYAANIAAADFGDAVLVELALGIAARNAGR